ncbi:MAG: outer membrane protein assembly factor BamD [candidate division Zixibacteria bacterium]|nr:outer membrane protein assembly factor BamD [candidate division Zixibacteria bacterium]MCI0597435.1 outer membrane protein assembly factor BamD [candidate division Zixibacteria bacterium]
MSRFISENFIPVKFHVKEKPDAFPRFGAQWTPTQLVMDAEGVERHRMEGFFPVEDFLAQLELGLAKMAFQKQQFREAEKRFRQACQTYPNSGAAPEACYWAGVSAYKATNKPEPLGEAAKVLKEKYPESEWARKSSVWLR